VKINNPLDIQTATWFDYPKLRQMFDVLLRCDYAVTAFMVDPQDETEADTESFDRAIHTLLESVKEKSACGQAALLSSLPESLSKETREKCLQAGVVPLQGLAESLEALHHAAKINEAWNKWSLPKIISPIQDTSSFRIFNESESKDMLSGYGFTIPKNRLVLAKNVSTVAEEIGFPVVLKAVAPEISHKTEYGGVALNLKNISEVVETATGMSGIAEYFLVEEMISDGVAELILGVSVDPQFGPTLTLGAGGIYSELLKDSFALLFPVLENEVRQTIEKMRINALLKGWRGKPEGDIDALVGAVLALAHFVECYADRLVGCDINPLIVRPRGKGVVAVDVLINLK